MASRRAAGFGISRIAGLACALVLGAGRALAAQGAEPPGDDRPGLSACLAAGAKRETDWQEALLARAQRRGPELDMYRDAIAREEAESGTLDPRLIPEWLGLGFAARDAGDQAWAAEAFDRALLLTRASEGLYDPGQFPLIEYLIESRAATGDWRAVEAGYALMQWLLRRDLPADSPSALPLLRRLRDWHLDAYNKDTGTPLAVHVEAAERLYAQAASIIGRCGGDARTVACYMRDECCAGDPPAPNCTGAVAAPDLNSAGANQSKSMPTH